MGGRRFRSRRKVLEEEARLTNGSRVRYVGRAAGGIKTGASGTIVSDVPSRMDVTPFATPPTVPEQDVEREVEVDFDGVGRRHVALEDLVPDEA